MRQQMVSDAAQSAEPTVDAVEIHQALSHSRRRAASVVEPLFRLNASPQ
jgi:hypothetical protein